MANSLFDPGREGFLDESIRWISHDMRVMLVAASYKFSARHRFVADLGNADNGRSAALTAKTATHGVADAADTSLVAIAAKASGSLVIFRHTGDDATARLVAYIDAPAMGLPFVPSVGQRVDISWDAGPNRIFKL